MRIRQEKRNIQSRLEACDGMPAAKENAVVSVFGQNFLNTNSLSCKISNGVVVPAVFAPHRFHSATSPSLREPAIGCREEVDPGSVDAKTISRLIHKFKSAASSSSSASQFKSSTPSSLPPPPIILIPGLASSQLHSWSSPPSCPSLRLFTLVWLHLPTMAKIFSTSSSTQAKCWMSSMKLQMDESDPPDFKVRPGTGLEAVSRLSPESFLASGLLGGSNTLYASLIFWLADSLNYDESSLFGLGFDWRLSSKRMQERDDTFQTLFSTINDKVKKARRPGVVVAHSLGNRLFQSWLRWVEHEFYKEVVAENAAPDSAAEEWSTWFSSFIWEEGSVNPTEEVITEWKIEGKRRFQLWLDTHISTYVGLSAPILGAVNPIRAVISGESMGLPVSERDSRDMELTFGSTSTALPISTSELADWEGLKGAIGGGWAGQEGQFSTLRKIVEHRMDWDNHFPLVAVTEADEKNFKAGNLHLEGENDGVLAELSPLACSSGEAFKTFGDLFPETADPLLQKEKQLRSSFYQDWRFNIFDEIFERPEIRHVILAYGTNLPTEIGYTYAREAGRGKDDLPEVREVIWEEAGGEIVVEEEGMESTFLKMGGKKRREAMDVVVEERLGHAGDGTIPYLSLAWGHTWLLDFARKGWADENNKSGIQAITRTQKLAGSGSWKFKGEEHDTCVKIIDGGDQCLDDVLPHPHLTQYHPKMDKWSVSGISTETNKKWTTTVLEADGVEHKETPRNFDILNAVFAEVLQFADEEFD
ncbi:hypothetical protein TL16_g01089 [Triparma laevis f. inornata]|uniref:Lecithin:cholesterol acyltransferase n=2 Tax=Triparma laevis TaxID=1534972 RepID=A0A9W6ZJR8_9STRA|nr:hypothetical protein TL16_g01089 [Triparma laevis f. inornata]